MDLDRFIRFYLLKKLIYNQWEGLLLALMWYPTVDWSAR
jgi:hypothetical protein